MRCCDGSLPHTSSQRVQHTLIFLKTPKLLRRWQRHGRHCAMSMLTPAGQEDRESATTTQVATTLNMSIAERHLHGVSAKKPAVISPLSTCSGPISFRHWTSFLKPICG